MRISIPRIVRKIDLAEYAPELVHPDGKPVLVWVWVNPPRDLMDQRRRAIEIGTAAYAAMNALLGSSTEDPQPTIDERRRILADLSETGVAIARWFSEIWSQHEDTGTHWSVEDVLELGTNRTDPALYPWLQQGTLQLISDHRVAEKKRPLTG